MMGKNVMTPKINTQLELAVFAAMIRCGADKKFVDEKKIIDNISEETKREWLNQNSGATNEDWVKRITWILSNLANDTFCEKGADDETVRTKKPKVQDANTGGDVTPTWKNGILEKKKDARTFSFSRDTIAYLEHLVEEYSEHLSAIEITNGNPEVYHDYTNANENKVILLDEDFNLVCDLLKQKGELPQSVREKTWTD